MADVTQTFRRHMLEDAQTETRYLRLVQRIATESLQEPGPPLRERLREVVALVMEAMGAQCAALALYDVARAELVVEASAGLTSIEPYAASLGSKSFVGEVAARAEPTTVYDVTSTPLELPEELRSSGIHSLLGVRLPARSALRGVMFVGSSQPREFTLGELGRLESLGEQLVRHLENARLVAELHATIDQLRVEEALRERFVSVLAHDLRGPLSAAALSATLLADQPSLAAERPGLAIRIQHSIVRAERMIRDLLDANRIRAGQPLPLQLAECDLTAVVQRVVEEATALHGDHFVVDCAPDHVVGIWSEDELHRALWNLVTNAVKYGAADRPITIRVERGDGTARVSVHNEGTPIPRKDQATIFDAYMRTSTARSSGSPGWGLGLTLVRGTAEAHGGRVTLRSDAAGTTFTVELPLDARPDQRAPAVASTTVH
jgi:signal transduction histidine kinase